MKRAPTYDLAVIKALAERGGPHLRIEPIAAQAAGKLYCGVEDIQRCVADLTSRDFYKSMESRKRPGLYHDVYKPRFDGMNLYVKIQLFGRDVAVVIQFKKNEQ